MVVDVIHAAAELQVGVVGVGAAAHGPLVEAALFCLAAFWAFLRLMGWMPGEDLVSKKELYKIKGGY